jgi:hypothetical protein
VVLYIGGCGRPANQPDARREAINREQSAHSKLSNVLWEDRGDIASLDLFYGAGRKDHAPSAAGTFKFIREDLGATSPKFHVEDEAGTRWIVKVGEEARPETAAARLVWAMGYFVDEQYFVRRIRVAGLPQLERSHPSVFPDGTVMDVRLERQDGSEKVSNWEWDRNPFVGTREFNGLRVLMALINNWDLTTSNNKVYEHKSERRYVISDLGASLGRTGRMSVRSKGVAKDFIGEPFIEKAGPDLVSFRMATRPSLVKAFNPLYYNMRTDVAKVAHGIPRADARWMGERFAKLTPRQVRDAFRAAGYTTQEVEAYASALEARVAELRRL